MAHNQDSEELKPLDKNFYNTLLVQALKKYDKSEYSEDAYNFETGWHGCIEPENVVSQSGISGVESYIHDLLISDVLQDVKNGISNALYWGLKYDKKQSEEAITEFRDEIETEEPKLKEFKSIVSGYRKEWSKSPPHLLKQIVDLRLPRFRNYDDMVFPSKVAMFIDPENCPVMDNRIVRFVKNRRFKPISPLLKSGKAIKAYGAWASHCRSIADSLPGKLRSVDIERAIFQELRDCRHEANYLLLGPTTED